MKTHLLNVITYTNMNTHYMQNPVFINKYVVKIDIFILCIFQRN